MDCLALTGSDPLPLTLIAVMLIAVAVALLAAVRRARRARGGRPGRSGAALTMMAVLTVTTAGGLPFVGTSTAQAATADSCAVGSTSDETVQAAGTATAEVASDSEQPAVTVADVVAATVTVEETAQEETAQEETTQEETTEEETTEEEATEEETTPDIEPVASILAVSFPEQTFATPTSVVSTESYTLVLSRVSGTDDSSPVDLVVPDSASGWWIAVDLLEADGSTATDVTVTRESGQTRFTVATQPVDSRTFLLVLQFDSTQWDSAPDETGLITARPATVLLVWLADHADPANNTAEVQIPEGQIASGGSSDGED